MKHAMASFNIGEKILVNFVYVLCEFEVRKKAALRYFIWNMYASDGASDLEQPFGLHDENWLADAMGLSQVVSLNLPCAHGTCIGSRRMRFSGYV